MMAAPLGNLELVAVAVVVVVVVAAALEAGCPEEEVVTAIANPLMEKLGRSSRLDNHLSGTEERGLPRSLDYSEV